MGGPNLLLAGSNGVWGILGFRIGRCRSIDRRSSREHSNVLRKPYRTLAPFHADRSCSAVAMTKHLLYDIAADTYQTAIENGVVVNATARMTDEC